MTSTQHFAILGGGLAGHSAAETLRREGFDGRITLMSAEAMQPYDRTLLSKAVLQGTRNIDDIAFRPLEHYTDLNVELLLETTVTDVDFSDRSLKLSGSGALSFDKLLIATGASPIRLPAPGFDLPGVHYLRTVEDAAAIQQDLDAAESVVVIGSGFIGAEVAASARTLGKHVALIDLLGSPIEAALGERIGRVYADIHRTHGVDLRMNTRVSELRGHQRVEEAVLANGDRIACDMVVVGVGVRPETALFESTELQTGNGVRVSASCEANIPGVFAAGDVANWWHPTIEGYVRIEHYNNAAEQAMVAARAMLGKAEPYAPLPYFWSDQYDVNLQYVGYPGAYDELIVREYPEDFALTAFYRQQNQILAAVTINRGKDMRSVRRLIAGNAIVEHNTLADPNVELRELVKALQQAG